MEGKSRQTLVMKFGGTSVGTPEAMRQAVEIVQRACLDWPQVVVVTSAVSGVTDLLLNSVRSAIRGDLGQVEAAEGKLRDVHRVIVERLLPSRSGQDRVLQDLDTLTSDFTNFCQAISVLGEASPRAVDAVAALGERMSVRVLSAALIEAGVPAEPVEATRLIVTDANFQDAHPDLEASFRKTHQELDPLIRQGKIPVVTGFIAATQNGITTTLGRGGSDYSAALLGAALQANEVWIWTDVDGVMSADPRIVPDARTIPELTFREVSELAYYGAKVLHPKTIRPVIEAGIGLRVCNTFNPDYPGTIIVANGVPAGNGVIKAVSPVRNQKLITIEGRGMLGVPGVAAKTFAAVASTGTSVPLITQASSEQSICFSVPASSADEVLSALVRVFSQELESRDIDRIWSTEEVVIVTVVGAGMRHTPGIAGKIFSALGAQGVNVIGIAQGSSEVSISLVVDAADEKAALKAIHSLIQNKETR